jgi:hypothetical protein
MVAALPFFFCSSDDISWRYTDSVYECSVQQVGSHSSFMIGTQQNSPEDYGTKYLKHYYDSLVIKKITVLFVVRDMRNLLTSVQMYLQIFQWLASMPVELEGYIRPGCTILTVFITMPKFMWAKVVNYWMFLFFIFNF